LRKDVFVILIEELVCDAKTPLFFNEPKYG